MNPAFLSALNRSVPAAEIVIKSGGTIVAPIQKNMKPSDFVGVNVVKLDAEENQLSCEVITSAELSSGVITLTAGDTTLTYTVATGAYAAA
jgi:hypothetical protein